jgi:hypothetical protein
MFFHESYEIGSGETRECRFAKVGISGYEIFGAGVEVRKITATAPGDQNFLARLSIMLKDQNRAAALSGLDGAHESGCAGPDYDDVVRTQKILRSEMMFVNIKQFPFSVNAGTDEEFSRKGAKDAKQN